MVVFLCLCFCGGGGVVEVFLCFCDGVFVCFFPKAAAKGSFKKRAVFKDCHQTSPKVLLK